MPKPGRKHCACRKVLRRKRFSLFVRRLISAVRHLTQYLAVNTITISCVIYPVKLSTLNSLLSNPKTYNVMQDSTSPKKCDLIYNPDGVAKFGGFKRAMFGHTSIPILDPSGRVCIKQCWYADSAENSSARHLYESASQIKELSRDINCSRWAAASMDLVYRFIEKESETRGSPLFDIPQLRYVNIALAIAENGSRDTFLLEEVIDEDIDGPFIKYIGNGSAVPILLAAKDRVHIADFLAFSQHVQYERTRKMAFVSDFQGI
jgi:hypothetical protein